MMKRKIFTTEEEGKYTNRDDYAQLEPQNIQQNKNANKNAQVERRRNKNGKIKMRENKDLRIKQNRNF